MKNKLKTLIALWRVINEGEGGCVFFRLTDKQQDDLLSDKGAEVDLKYIGVDKEVVEIVAKNIELVKEGKWYPLEEPKMEMLYLTEDDVLVDSKGDKVV